MARNKHSAALFEVIAKGRPLSPHPKPGLFSWLRGNPPLPAAAPKTILTEAPATPLAPAEGISLDTRHGQVCFQMTYTSAVIALFAMATLVGAAFLAGQRMRPTHPALADDSTAEVLQGPPNGNVVRITGAPTDYAKAPPSEIKPTLVKNPPDTIVRGKNRQRDLNYVLVQSYPPPELQMAEEARKILEDNGIECTIEHNVPHYPPAWNCVVGTWGFSHDFSASPEYKAYLQKIAQISQSFTKNKKKSFKAFAPTPVLWNVAKPAGRG